MGWVEVLCCRKAPIEAMLKRYDSPPQLLEVSRSPLLVKTRIVMIVGLHSLFWKCSSPCGVRLFTFEGVAGDPSSCSKLKLACKSCPSRFGINRSPYTRCLFLLGLAPGVRSLPLPMSSYSLSARLKAPALMGSDPARSTPFDFPNRLVAVGGVLESGGEASVGVC